MYKNPFYIENPVGNNVFSYEKRKLKKLFVPSLIEAGFENIELGNEVVFSDYDFEGNLIEACGLKNFYKLNWKGKTIYLFDNHNHAHYFWYLERFSGNIGNSNILFHVDEHSDMRDPGIYLSENYTLEDVFNYTNFELNVGNYIIPALKDGLISEVIQIRNEENLRNYLSSSSVFEKKSNIILNLDLDFFEPELDFIDYELKKKVILDIAEKSAFITVSTSPFFINQKLALEVFLDLFLEK